MESLIAAAFLWYHDLGTYEEYNSLLDKKFLQNPDSDILLELEWCSSDCGKTFEVLFHFWHYEYFQFFDTDIFGKNLFHGLETVYKSNSISLTEFGSRCYQLWTNLSNEPICDIEPFFTLSYADDCLSYGDEAQTRELYEKAFSFYK